MALYSDFGVTQTDNGFLQPKLKNRWRVEFVGLGGPRAGRTGDLDQQALTIQAVTVDRPKISWDEVQLDRYNSRGWIAAKHTWQPINITFEDDVGGRVTRLIQSQNEKMQRMIAPAPGRLLNTAVAGEDYKFSTRLILLDGDETPLEVWNTNGCWFQNIDYGDLDYAASEQVRIVATIRFDHANQIPVNRYTMANKKATGGAITDISDIGRVVNRVANG